MNASPAEPDRADTAQRSRPLRLDDFEVLRVAVIGWVLVTCVLMVGYWVAWIADRGLVASEHSSQYVSFEQAFPLADAWLLTALVATGFQLWRRRPSALAWMFAVGGAGLYLCGMDVLYDVQHHIYTRGHGGLIELAINILTAISSVGIMSFGWRFREQLL
jgi:hypothetical protein